MVIVEHNLVASMWDGDTSGVHSKVKIELYVLSKIKQSCFPVIVEIALSEDDCLGFCVYVNVFGVDINCCRKSIGIFESELLTKYK